MQQKKGKDMRLRIVACRHVYRGRNTRGDEYDIYEVDAVKADGSLINEKLRAFTELPIGQELEVTVTPFDSEQWGRSFTLHPKGRKSAQLNELGDRIATLAEAVDRLTQRVAALEGAGGGDKAPAEEVPAQW